MDPAALEELLERAASTPLARPSVAAFAASVPPASLRAAFAVALERRGPHAASVLAFSLAAAGESLPADPLLELLADLESIAIFTPLVAAAEGDRIALLLAFVERGCASWEREALALFLATRLLEGRPPPAALKRQLRSLARQPLELEARILVGLALRALDDAALAPLVERLLPARLAERYEETAAEYAAMLGAAPLDALPEREPPRVVSGYTVVRTTPKIGRNEPCPCGSGKKYKRCCAEKDLERAGFESPADQLARLGEGRARLRSQLAGRLRPSELARLDPARLDTLDVISAMRRLTTHRRWDAASHFADELARRGDLPSALDDYHRDIADEALDAGAFEVALRHFELAHPAAGDREEFETRLALARRSPDALERVEALLESALRRDDESLVIECAHGLLQAFPALGILAARGAISADRALDSEVLMEAIHDARDRLLLDPYEPWWGVLDVLLRRAEAAERHGGGEGERVKEQVQWREEVERLRAAQREAEARAASLQSELARRLDELEHLSAEQTRLAEEMQAVRKEDSVARAAELETECLRLKRAVAQLEHAVSAGAEQRGELRRELKRVMSTSRPSPATPSGTGPSDTTSSDEDRLPEEVLVPRRILLPHYGGAAARALAELPKEIAAHALRVVAALAGGDPFAWAGVKRMRTAPDTYSARVGRAYRLLFRLASEQLEIADVVARKDLETTLRHR